MPRPAKRKRVHEPWDAMFERLLDFRARHGHALVPVRYRKNRTLGNWVSNQRGKAKKGLLRPEQRARLEKIGFVFVALDRQWQKMYIALLVFQREHGHTRVPIESKHPRGLGRWVSSQRSKFARGELPEERVRLLDEIGFDWTWIDPRWTESYLKLLEFYKEHGHCRVPHGHDANLHGWMRHERKLRQQGKLQPEQIELLDQIGFTWKKPPRRGPDIDARWRERIRALQAYKDQHGHCDVPQDEHAGTHLGDWVSRVRTQYTRGELPSERVRELDAMGFAWNQRDANWNRHINELTLYKAKHGHCKVTRTQTANRPLASFLMRAREARRAGKLSNHREQQLDSLGIEWEPAATSEH